MISDVIILLMEWIGTIAFALSGALVAISCSLDLLGVIIVGSITAVGGGMIRDLLLGNTPPKIFFNAPILLCAIGVSVLVFIIGYLHRKDFEKFRARTDLANNFFDAVGLASFSVTGVEIACLSGHQDNIILAVVMGVMTGVGGGVVRDILVNKKPYILTKHVYAVVSILASALYYLLGPILGYKIFATFLALVFTVAMRLLAAKFHWKLPKIHFEGEEKD